MLCYFDRFILAVKLILMERCQPWKAAPPENMHSLGSSSVGPCTLNLTVGCLWSGRSAHNCQFETQSFGPQNTIYDFAAQHRASFTCWDAICLCIWLANLWCPRQKKASEAAFAAQVLKVILCHENTCFPSHPILAWHGDVWLTVGGQPSFIIHPAADSGPTNKHWISSSSRSCGRMRLIQMYLVAPSFTG